MKSFLNSTQWKTDPRAVFIPPVLLTVFVLGICLAVSPAWSFETYHAHIHNSSSEKHISQNYDASFHKQDRAFQSSSSPSSSSVQVDSCLPLLSSTHTSHLDRTQRSAGSKAAALGLVFGVRFALTPPSKAYGGNSFKPRLDVWQPISGAGGDRSALAVAAYRECQKRQALQALKGFRWKR